MLIAKNPGSEKIYEIMSLSKDKAAKWISDKDDGAIYYWPSDKAHHAAVAAMFHIKRYEKGIAIEDPR